MNNESLIKIKNHTKSLCGFFIDLVYPVECIECGKEGKWICNKCFNKIDLAKEQKCLICNRKNEWGQICKKHKKYLNGCLVAGNYKNKILHKTIKTFKYNFIQSLSIQLGKYLSRFFLNIIIASENPKNKAPKIFELTNVIFIPIPLHIKRLHYREFNQSELLLKELTKHISLTINTKNLVRIKHNKPQAKLKRKNRLTNIKNSFDWTGDDLIKQNVILVDDVTTSGSTLEECAKVLKQNGANEVWGLVLARG